ncbi:MAG: ATP-binding cassette domain-containing protein [Candidatus Cloacimonetes bacterium]|nr:ATP-binding cassette domain-containing protein [Candidatus Cloacimonadota bacterium]
MLDNLVEVKNLKKYFNTPSGVLHAVDDVSFEIPRGKTLGIVGESGCGKSTLGRVSMRLLDSTSGTIIFDGKDITDASGADLKALRCEMQMIFQDPYASLDPRMEVGELIGEPLKVHKVCASKDEYNSTIKSLMDTVGLAERFLHSFPHELDGGRRQRIGIARALALKPQYIVCDEPVSALDVSIQAQILNLMQDIQKERKLTYMFITHDLSVVKHISDEICVMYLGQIVEKSPTKELFANPTHPYSVALLSAIPIPKVNIERNRIILKGEITSPINPKPGCRFAKRCLYATERCFAESPELREISKGHFVACHNI